MNYFVLTMQHNEDLMLPIFLKHYSRFLDPKHIKVIDHGSTNITLSNYERMYIPRDRPFSESARLRIIQHVVSGLLEYYDFGIFVDCDELIDLTDIDKIDFNHHRIHFVAGFDVFFRQTAQGTRIHGLLNPGMCKPSIFKYMPYWSAGFHESKDEMNILRFPMAHIRFLYKDLSLDRLRSRVETQVGMPSQETKNGVNIHWADGVENQSNFYRYVDIKRGTEYRPFGEIDPNIFADPAAKARAYRFSSVEYDLTERFSHLLQN